jgi:dTMP kinase
MKQGKFIVIEGVDGAGKTTQVFRMAELTNCHVTRQPSYLPVGKVIREILRDKHDDRRPSSEQFALMWATDRLAQQEQQIMPEIHAGRSVICDRWYHSSMAYQSGGTVTQQWIREINRHALEPDLTILLNVDPGTARRRIADRIADQNTAVGIFDAELDRVARNYQFVATLLRCDYQENVLVINGERDVDDISQEILRAIRDLHREQP